MPRHHDDVPAQAVSVPLNLTNGRRLTSVDALLPITFYFLRGVLHVVVNISADEFLRARQERRRGRRGRVPARLDRPLLLLRLRLFLLRVPAQKKHLVTRRYRRGQ